MTKAIQTTNFSTTTNERGSGRAAVTSSSWPVVVSTGCPRGIGPEVAVVAAYHLRDSVPVVLVGDRAILAQAAARRKIPQQWLENAPDFTDITGKVSKQTLPRLSIDNPAGPLSTSAQRLGKPSKQDGLAQLLYIERAYQIAKQYGWAMATGPVSKEVIAHCGEKRAKRFLGHTEWLEALDSAPYSVMCFQSERLTCSLVTTHVPVRKLSQLLSAELVRRATVELYDLVARLGKKRPKIAICSLNPHAGEGELLGSEERTAIVPGIALAKKQIGNKAQLIGPIGAETAFRKAAAAQFDAVVAMYHDQATIPMKVLAFGDAVNVTQGLSVVRTSVDHGTAYDIAPLGIADEQGMISALVLAGRLHASRRKI